MDVKLVFRINWSKDGATPVGEAGFSEVWYTDADGLFDPKVDNAVNRYALNRGACLNRGSVIVDCRVSIPGQKGSRIIRLNVPGALAGQEGSINNPELVNVAVNVRCTTVSGVRRQFLHRAVPDGEVSNGQFYAALNGTAPYNNFWQHLRGQGGYPPLRILAQTLGSKYMVGTVTGSNGHITIDASHSFSEGQRVYLQTRIVGNGCKVDTYATIVGLYATGPSGYNTWLLKSWKRGDCVGGTVQEVSYASEAVSEVYVPPAPLCHTRKTGRPFGLLRGVQSRRC